MRCSRTRGKKGIPHDDPADPPRRRANKQRGHGTFDNDRVPIQGIAGRKSEEIRLKVCHRTTREELEPTIEEGTQEQCTVNTDEWSAYNHISETGREHVTVNHGAREWARDDDGDGICEVHVNTMEGIWTGLRNFLRDFRGVSKWFLAQYVAVFEWAYNLKDRTIEFLRILVGTYLTT